MEGKREEAIRATFRLRGEKAEREDMKYTSKDMIVRDEEREKETEHEKHRDRKTSGSKSKKK